MASRLVTGSIVLLLAGTAASGTFWLLSNAAYLRSSAPVISSIKTETVPSAESKTFSVPNVPFTFKYPANWQLITKTDNSVTTITLESIKISEYGKSDINQSRLAAQELLAHEDNLMSWPGKIGQVAGTFWAKASTVGDTKAPDGPRVFFTTNNQTSIVLPQPPYSDGVTRVMDSLSSR